MSSSYTKNNDGQSTVFHVTPGKLSTSIFYKWRWIILGVGVMWFITIIGMLI